MKGLQLTSLAVHSGFDIQRRECLNVYGSHWITIAGDSSPGTVNIMIAFLIVHEGCTCPCTTRTVEEQKNGLVL